jgi:hypothetical protein
LSALSGAPAGGWHTLEEDEEQEREALEEVLEDAEDG